MAEFEIRPRDRDAALAVWIVGLLLIALLTIIVAFSERVEEVTGSIGMHVGTVLIVMLLGVVAWLVGRGKPEKTGLWRYG